MTVRVDYAELRRKAEGALPADAPAGAWPDMLNLVDDPATVLQICEDVKELVEAHKKTLAALQLLRGLVSEGGVPRYTVTPGAALNAVIEEDVDPAIRAARALLSKHQEPTTS